MITEENRTHEKDQKISTNQPTTAKQKTSVRGKCPKVKGSNHYFQRKRARTRSKHRMLFKNTIDKKEKLNKNHYIKIKR